MTIPSPFKVEYEVKPHSQFNLEMTLSLTPEQIKEFLKRLEPVQRGKEVRLRLSHPSDSGDQWLLFIKLSSGENRCMVAHPESDQWVGTVALQPSSFECLIKSLESKQSISIGQLGLAGIHNNFHLVLTPIF